MVAKPDSSGSVCRRAVRTPSVTTSSRVSALKRRSKRTCQPTSRPIVQPRSSAMRAAIARAATRRGWSRMTGPSANSAGGTRVVLPAPGAAVTTTARDRRTRSTIWSTYGSIGSGITAKNKPRRSQRPQRNVALCGLRGKPSSRGRLDSDRAADAGAAETAVAVWVFREILLVVVLGVEELRRRHDLRGDRAVTGRGQLLLKRDARHLRRTLLLGVLDVDPRAILGADVVALPHPLRRIVVLPED